LMLSVCDYKKMNLRTFIPDRFLAKRYQLWKRHINSSYF